MRRSVTAVLALAAIGCSDRPFSIAALRISGHSAVAEDVLREAAGNCATAEECAADIEAHYFDHGYVTASVAPATSLLQAFTGQSSALTVIEGPRFTVRAVDIVEPAATDELGDPARLAALSAVRVGSPFLRTDMTATYQALRERYGAAGYRDAVVVPVTRIDQARATIELALEVERGPRSP